MASSRLLSGCGITSVVLALCILVPIGCPIAFVLLSEFHIGVTKVSMSRQRVYGPVAQTLALYCQTDPKLLPSDFDRAWLPRELDDIGSFWTTITPTGAHIEMGAASITSAMISPSTRPSPTRIPTSGTSI